MDAKKETKEKSKIISWEELVANQVLDEWDKGQSYVGELNDLFDDIYDMFRGERPVKNFDWQSNITINKTFQIVWTAVPYLIKKIFGATPIIGVKSYDKKGAWQREQVLEFWNTLQGVENSDHIPYFLIVVSVLIRDVLNGMGVVKKTWTKRTKTEKGKKFILEDWPKNIVCNNRDVVYDWLLSPEQSIRQGRFVIHRSKVDLGTLYGDGVYMNLDEINLEQTTTDEDSKSKEGQDTKPTSEIYTDVEIYERVGKWNVYYENGEWLPILTKGGYEEKDVQTKYMVATVAKGGTDKKDVLIRFDPSPYEEINYIDVKCYLDTERFNSQGIVEPTKDTITALNDIINGTMDEMWKNLMPPVIVNQAALWEWDTMVYAPHQRWLMSGDPRTGAEFVQPSSVTRDAWNTYSLLDNEAQQMSITNAMTGMGKEKTATTNVMNAQLSAGKLDFILQMVETTFLVPSAQMDIRFAKKFAEQETLDLIVTAASKEQDRSPVPFKFGDWDEVFKYVPAASSVKIEHLKDMETKEDIQLLQLLSGIKNPKTAKVMNKVLANIFRNRNMPQAAELLDEDYFDPESAEGRTQELLKTLGGASNQHGVEMTGQEKSVRGQFNPRGIDGN